MDPSGSASLDEGVMGFNSMSIPPFLGDRDPRGRLGTEGEGIQTDTTEERMGRYTPVSFPLNNMTMTNTIVVNENRTWAVKNAQCAL
jgi:hypothetical protein